MKKYLQGVVCLFFLFCMFLLNFSDNEHLYAAENQLEQNNIVYTETELIEWLTSHYETGGTVYLGNSIEITQIIGVRTKEEAPITIDTQSFGLIINGGRLLNASEFLQIEGDGVNQPVVDIQAVSEMRMRSWNNDLVELNIMSRGFDGEGGVALRITKVDDKAFNIGSLAIQGHLTSYGKGAIGIQLMVPTEVQFLSVDVYGEESQAISAPKDSTFYYCKFRANGLNAQSVVGEQIILDTCITSPAPRSAQTVSRQALDIPENHFYLPIKQNEKTNYAKDLIQNMYPVFLLSGNDSFKEKERVFFIDWSEDEYESIDSSILGKTNISGQVSPLYDDFGVFDVVAPQLTVEVRNPEIPCIYRVKITEDADGKFAQLFTWKSYDPQAGDIILWRSDDRGVTWKEATYAPDIEWLGDEIRIHYQEFKNPIFFVLEEKNVGESNMAFVYAKDKIAYGGPGGDRTGTDRKYDEDGKESLEEVRKDKSTIIFKKGQRDFPQVKGNFIPTLDNTSIPYQKPVDGMRSLPSANSEKEAETSRPLIASDTLFSKNTAAIIPWVIGAVVLTGTLLIMVRIIWIRGRGK